MVGGTSAFSTAIDTVTIVTTAVNDAPAVTSGATLAYTEQATAAVIDGTITVADVDNATLTGGATVTISAGSFVAGDTLTWTNAGAVTGSYNAVTGVLTLIGTDTPANYEAVLRSVTAG